MPAHLEREEKKPEFPWFQSMEVAPADLSLSENKSSLDFAEIKATALNLLKFDSPTALFKELGAWGPAVLKIPAIFIALQNVFANIVIAEDENKTKTTLTQLEAMLTKLGFWTPNRKSNKKNLNESMAELQAAVEAVNTVIKVNESKETILAKTVLTKTDEIIKVMSLLIINIKQFYEAYNQNNNVSNTTAFITLLGEIGNTQPQLALLGSALTIASPTLLWSRRITLASQALPNLAAVVHDKALLEQKAIELFHLVQSGDPWPAGSLLARLECYLTLVELLTNPLIFKMLFNVMYNLNIWIAGETAKKTGGIASGTLDAASYLQYLQMIPSLSFMSSFAVFGNPQSPLINAAIQAARVASPKSAESLINVVAVLTHVMTLDPLSAASASRGLLGEVFSQIAQNKMSEKLLLLEPALRNDVIPKILKAIFFNEDELQFKNNDPCLSEDLTPGLISTEKVNKIFGYILTPLELKGLTSAPPTLENLTDVNLEPSVASLWHSAGDKVSDTAKFLHYMFTELGTKISWPDIHCNTIRPNRYTKSAYKAATKALRSLEPTATPPSAPSAPKEEKVNIVDYSIQTTQAAAVKEKLDRKKADLLNNIDALQGCTPPELKQAYDKAYLEIVSFEGEIEKLIKDFQTCYLARIMFKSKSINYKKTCTEELLTSLSSKACSVMLLQINADAPQFLYKYYQTAPLQPLAKPIDLFFNQAKEFIQYMGPQNRAPLEHFTASLHVTIKHQCELDIEKSYIANQLNYVYSKTLREAIDYLESKDKNPSADPVKILAKLNPDNHETYAISEVFPSYKCISDVNSIAQDNALPTSQTSGGYIHSMASNLGAATQVLESLTTFLLPPGSSQSGIYSFIVGSVASANSEVKSAANSVADVSRPLSPQEKYDAEIKAHTDSVVLFNSKLTNIRDIIKQEKDPLTTLKSMLTDQPVLKTEKSANDDASQQYGHEAILKNEIEQSPAPKPQSSDEVENNNREQNSLSEAKEIREEVASAALERRLLFNEELRKALRSHSPEQASFVASPPLSEEQSAEWREEELPQILTPREQPHDDAIPNEISPIAPQGVIEQKQERSEQNHNDQDKFPNANVAPLSDQDPHQVVADVNQVLNNNEQKLASSASKPDALNQDLEQVANENDGVELPKQLATIPPRAQEQQSPFYQDDYPGSFVLTAQQQILAEEEFAEIGRQALAKSKPTEKNVSSNESKREVEPENIAHDKVASLDNNPLTVLSVSAQLNQENKQQKVDAKENEISPLPVSLLNPEIIQPGIKNNPAAINSNELNRAPPTDLAPVTNNSPQQHVAVGDNPVKNNNDQKEDDSPKPSEALPFLNQQQKILLEIKNYCEERKNYKWYKNLNFFMSKQRKLDAAEFIKNYVNNPEAKQPNKCDLSKISEEKIIEIIRSHHAYFQNISIIDGAQPLNEQQSILLEIKNFIDTPEAKHNPNAPSEGRLEKIIKNLDTYFQNRSIENEAQPLDEAHQILLEIKHYIENTKAKKCDPRALSEGKLGMIIKNHHAYFENTPIGDSIKAHEDSVKTLRKFQALSRPL